MELTIATSRFIGVKILNVRIRSGHFWHGVRQTSDLVHTIRWILPRHLAFISSIDVSVVHLLIPTTMKTSSQWCKRYLSVLRTLA